MFKKNVTLNELVCSAVMIKKYSYQFTVTTDIFLLLAFAELELDNIMTEVV